MIRTLKPSTIPAESPKPRYRNCKVCKARFQKRSMGHVACSPACAQILAERAREKKAKADYQARKQAIKPLKDRLKLAEKAVNRYVRARDARDGCISCDKGPHWDGVWHASHFKSVGSNSVLRFNLLNIHKACDQCNYFKGGNIASYRPRLELKIGADRVSWLDSQNGIKRYESEYLDRLTRVMNKKARRAEKRLAVDKGVA